MDQTKTKLGLVLAATYLSVVAAYTAYVFYRITFAPINSEFIAVPLILLTLPWSMLALALVDFDSEIHIVITAGLMLLCALLNASLIYFAVRAIKFAFRSPAVRSKAQ